MGNVEIKDLLRYAEDGNVEAVKKLAKHKEANAVSDETGNTPMHCACFQGHVEVVRVLLRAGMDVNKVNLDRDTPLHLAALGKRQKCIKLLTATGKINIGAQNADGFTALHFCAGENHLSGAKHLLQETTPSANPRVTNNDGQTPLALAVMQGHAPMTEFLLQVDASVVNWKDVEGDTALHTAVDLQRPDLVEMLLASRADLEVVGGRDLSPLELAQSIGNMEVIESLKRALLSQNTSGGGNTAAPTMGGNNNNNNEGLLGISSTIGINTARRGFVQPQQPMQPQQQLFQKAPPGGKPQNGYEEYLVPGALPPQQLSQQQQQEAVYLSNMPPQRAVAPPTLHPNNHSSSNNNNNLSHNDGSPRSPAQLGKPLQAPHPALQARQQQQQMQQQMYNLQQQQQQQQQNYNNMGDNRNSSSPMRGNNNNNNMMNGNNGGDDVAQLQEEVAAMRADRISQALRAANTDLNHMSTEAAPESVIGSVRPLFYSRYSNPPTARVGSISAAGARVVAQNNINVAPPPLSAGGMGGGRRIPQAMFAPSMRPAAQQQPEAFSPPPPPAANVHSRYQAYRSGQQQ